jgi:hypothetical protein
LRDSAEELSECARRSPARVGTAFATVAEVAVLGTVLISGALATVHLYRALFPRHKEAHVSPELVDHAHSPPRRRGPRAPALAAKYRRGEDDRSPSRKHQGPYWTTPCASAKNRFFR